MKIHQTTILPGALCIIICIGLPAFILRCSEHFSHERLHAGMMQKIQDSRGKAQESLTVCEGLVRAGKMQSAGEVKGKDAWGSVLEIFIAERAGDVLMLASGAGPDKTQGTLDDIVVGRVLRNVASK